MSICRIVFLAVTITAVIADKTQTAGRTMRRAHRSEPESVNSVSIGSKGDVETQMPPLPSADENHRSDPLSFSDDSGARNAARSCGSQPRYKFLYPGHRGSTVPLGVFLEEEPESSALQHTTDADDGTSVVVENAFRMAATTMTELKALVTTAFPDVAPEAERYFNAATEGLNSVASATKQFASGDDATIASGAESLFNGLVKSVDTALSAEQKATKAYNTYQLVVGNISGALNGIGGIVEGYKGNLAKTDSCWKDSEGRGVGTVPKNCKTASDPEKTDYDAGLCYKPCPAEYNGVGPVCWRKSHGRGLGKPPHTLDESNKGCGPDMDPWLGLCYQLCPDGWKGEATLCYHKDATEASYARGVGRIPGCRDGMENSAGLCYPTCRDGYEGQMTRCIRVPGSETGSSGSGTGKQLSCGKDRKSDTDVSGAKRSDTYPDGVKAISADECCEKCNTDTFCTAYVFQPSRGYCWPLKSFGHTTNARDRIFGETHMKHIQPKPASALQGSKPDGEVIYDTESNKGSFTDINVSVLGSVHGEAPSTSYSRGQHSSALPCNSDQDKWGALCYPKCRDGYKAIGCCICQTDSYDRGLGSIPGDCNSNEDNFAGLCYPKCRDHYKGIGPVCWREVKSRGTGKIPTECPDGWEQSRGLCYPECKKGYGGEGPLCHPVDESTQELATLSITRGIGVPPGCDSDMEKDAGLCYKPCAAGFKGIGPICWHECGAYGRSNADVAKNGLKCAPGNDRIFDLRGGAANEDDCKKACDDNSTCVAFSGIFGAWCIGCKAELSAKHPKAVAYKKLQDHTTTTSYSMKQLPGGGCSKSSKSNVIDTMDCRDAGQLTNCEKHGKTLGFSFSIAECSAHCLSLPNCNVYDRTVHGLVDPRRSNALNGTAKGQGVCTFYDSSGGLLRSADIPSTCVVKEASTTTNPLATIQDPLTVDGGAMCCIDQQTCTKKGLDMAFGTIGGAVTAGVQFTSGQYGSGLNSLAKLGTPFAMPKCSELHEKRSKKGSSLLEDEDLLSDWDLLEAAGLLDNDVPGEAARLVANTVPGVKTPKRRRHSRKRGARPKLMYAQRRNGLSGRPVGVLIDQSGGNGSQQAGEDVRVDVEQGVILAFKSASLTIANVQSVIEDVLPDIAPKATLYLQAAVTGLDSVANAIPQLTSDNPATVGKGVEDLWTNLLSSVDSALTPEQKQTKGYLTYHAVTGNISGAIEGLGGIIDSYKQGLDSTDACWKSAKGRGVGTPARDCKDNDNGNTEFQAGLCYKPCPAGMNGVGPVCWRNSHSRGVGKIPGAADRSNNNGCPPDMDYSIGLCYQQCPPGWRGSGPSCHPEEARDMSIGRGIGKPMQCPSDMENSAGLCYKKCKDGFRGSMTQCYPNRGGLSGAYFRGLGKIPSACGDDEDKHASLCYAKCKEGYKGIGPVCWRIIKNRGAGSIPGNCPADHELSQSLCYKNCRSGHVGIGPLCHPTDKKGEMITISKDRGVGTLPHCEDGKEYQAGLCYKPCPSGFKGIGPVCWHECRDPLSADGGAMCCDSPQTCTQKGLDQFMAILTGGITSATKFLTGNIGGGLNSIARIGSPFALPQCDALHDKLGKLLEY